MRKLIDETPAEPPIPDDLRAYPLPQTAEILGVSEVYRHVMLKGADIRSVKGRALARS